jgi:hypothetical protein
MTNKTAIGTSQPNFKLESAMLVFTSIDPLETQVLLDHLLE